MQNVAKEQWSLGFRSSRSNEHQALSRRHRVKRASGCRHGTLTLRLAHALHHGRCVKPRDSSHIAGSARIREVAVRGQPRVRVCPWQPVICTQPLCLWCGGGVCLLDAHGVEWCLPCVVCTDKNQDAGTLAKPYKYSFMLHVCQFTLAVSWHAHANVPGVMWPPAVCWPLNAACLTFRTMAILVTCQWQSFIAG